MGEKIAAIGEAFRLGYMEVVQALITAGADVNFVNEQGDTMLMRAAGAGNLERVKALIAAGADVNAKGRYEYTPLMEACRNNQRETAMELIAAGADINAKNYRGETVLSIAKESGATMLARYLQSIGAREE